MGLARVMAGKYDWKPGQGVRSAGDVFNLIVMENKMLAGLLTGAGAPGGDGMGGRGNQVTDPAEMQEALRSSYGALKQALSGLSDSDLKANVKMFGRETTKQGAALMLLFDQHEHLGQSIAYAVATALFRPGANSRSCTCARRGTRSKAQPGGAAGRRHGRSHPGAGEVRIRWPWTLHRTHTGYF